MLKGLERDKLFLKFIAEGLYSVSNEGIFKNSKGKVLAGSVDSVVIGKDRQYFSITRTRAVWLAYKGEIPEVEGDAYYVALKDKSAPLHIDNLKLQLRSEISRETGKRMVNKINCRASAKMTDEQVLALRREFVANPKVFFIRRRAKELGIAHASLSFALSGKTYAHIGEAVPKELLKKKGGNCKPRVWDRRTCPSYNKTYKPKTPKPPKPRAERPKVEKPVAQIIPFKPKPAPVKVMTEEEKRNRLEMMKNIGKRLNKARDVE